jgi:hypothetical protein
MFAVDGFIEANSLADIRAFVFTYAMLRIIDLFTPGEN